MDPVTPRVLEVEMLMAFSRGFGPPQLGPGPPRAHLDPQPGPGLPRAYSDPREPSAQHSAREGSGAATCPIDVGVGAGASLPLGACPPRVPQTRA